MEKQRDKTAKRLQRKLGRLEEPAASGDNETGETGEAILPTDETTGLTE